MNWHEILIILNQSSPLLLVLCAVSLYLHIGIQHLAIEADIGLGLLMAIVLMEHTPFWGVLLMAGLAGAFSGALYITAIYKLHLPSHMLGILMSILITFVLFLSPQAPTALIPLFLQQNIGWVSMAFVGVLYGVMQYSAMGIRLRAIGYQARAVAQADIDIPLYRTALSIFASGLAALAGALSVLNAGPSMQGLGWLAVVMAVVVRGNFLWLLPLSIGFTFFQHSSDFLADYFVVDSTFLRVFVPPIVLYVLLVMRMQTNHPKH